MIAAVASLGALGGSIILFGGWAEELQGLRPPGPHRDVDLLLLAPDFVSLERVKAADGGRWREIRAKRFAHKRAWSGPDDLMVEFLLVTPGEAGPLTRFWGDLEYRWLEPLSDRSIPLATGSLALTSAANLERYRRLHATLEPWRWRDPRSLVDRAR